MEVFVFARLHARPGKLGEVHRAMFDSISMRSCLNTIRFVQTVEPILDHPFKATHRSSFGRVGFRDALAISSKTEVSGRTS